EPPTSRSRARSSTRVIELASIRSPISPTSSRNYSAAGPRRASRSSYRTPGTPDARYERLSVLPLIACRVGGQHGSGGAVGQVVTDERKAMRDECSLPVLAELYDWVEKIDSKIAPRSRLHQALTYARNQRPYFEGCFVGVRSTKSSSAIVLARYHADLPNPVSPDSMGIARPTKVCNASVWVRGCSEGSRVRKAPPPASAKGRSCWSARCLLTGTPDFRYTENSAAAFSATVSARTPRLRRVVRRLERSRARDPIARRPLELRHVL